MEPTRYWTKPGLDTLTFDKPPDVPFHARRGESLTSMQVVSAADYDRDVGALQARVKELVQFYGKHYGTPCEQIRHGQQVKELEDTAKLHLDRCKSDMEHIVDLEQNYEQATKELVTLQQHADALAEALEKCKTTMADMKTELTDEGYYCEGPEDETPWQTICTERLIQWDEAQKAIDTALARWRGRGSCLTSKKAWTLFSKQSLKLSSVIWYLVRSRTNIRLACKCQTRELSPV